MTNDRESKPKKRIAYIDIARGIAILLMIVGHAISFYWGKAFIFSFHMPLFIIVSGFFFKDQNFKDAIISSFKKLFLPTAFIVFLIELCLSVPENGLFNSLIPAISTTIFGISYENRFFFPGNGTGVLWFIYMLIAIRILFLINKRITRQDNLLLGLLVLIESFAGYLLGTHGFWLPWSFDIALVGTLFYYIGYLLKQYNLLPAILANWRILLACLIIWVVGIRFDWIELAMRNYPNGPWSFIAAICGSIIVIKFSQLIEQKSRLLTRALSWCGKNSLYILYGHHIEWSLISYSFMLALPLPDGFKLSIVKLAISILIAALLVKLQSLFHLKSKLGSRHA